MSIPAEQHEVYAEFGFAAEKGQLLELEAGNFALSYLTFFLDTSSLSAEEKSFFRGVTDELNSKTLGALFKFVKKSGSLDDSITSCLDEALELRNHLTHHFFRTHNFAIFSDAGRTAMIDELRQIQGKLNLALAMLQGMTNSMERVFGKENVSEEQAIEFQMRGKKVNI